MEQKIELSPKLIPNLESICYIAVGKNHSVAIKHQPSRGKKY